jgi:hypothetical protein
MFSEPFNRLSPHSQVHSVYFKVLYLTGVVVHFVVQGTAGNVHVTDTRCYCHDLSGKRWSSSVMRYKITKYVHGIATFFVVSELIKIFSDFMVPSNSTSFA